MPETGGRALKSLLKEGKTLAVILWLSLVVAYRFWHWRLSLWRHPEQLTESITKRMERTLLFIRHGETTWNVEHILPGQLPDVKLTETGHEQATRLGEALQVLPISILVSSPLERARDTAGYIARPLALPVHFEDDLMDTNIGAWAGKKIEDLYRDDPVWKEFVRDPTVAPAGHETFPQVQERAVAVVERWLKQEPEARYLAFVAHADVVKLLLAHYMGLDAARAGRLLIENASVSIVELDKEQHSRVLAMGWSPRPGWLKLPIPVSTVLPSAPTEAPAPTEESEAR